MSRMSIKKSFSGSTGLLAFTLVFFGSWFYEARILSSFFRGVEGFVIFGLLTWLILRGWAVLNLKESPGENKDKGVNLDHTA